MDLTKRSEFPANQLRALLLAAAYVLLQELTFTARSVPGRARLAGPRLDLLRVGVKIVRLLRRIGLCALAAFPRRDGNLVEITVHDAAVLIEARRGATEIARRWRSLGCAATPSASRSSSCRK